MELIIKETEYVEEKTCKQNPVFKIEDGVLIDCELNGSKTVTIPNEVKVIEEMCFASTNIEEVILPEGIKIIKARAFANCNKLYKINFPKSLNTIKERSFFSCSSLTEVMLPETLTETGDYAFYSAGIKQLVLPKKIILTGINVFAATKIKAVDIPEKFKLGKAMFAGCTNLCAVNFEADWVTIPERCFYCCTNLAKIDISKALLIEDSAFLKCRNLSVNIIPADTYVGACAFSETGVKNVTIENISIVSGKAFSDCKSLKN